MKIDSAQEGGRTVVRLSGRLDREWAEQLSNTLEDLLQSGVRSLSIDFSSTYFVNEIPASAVSRPYSRKLKPPPPNWVWK